VILTVLFALFEDKEGGVVVDREDDESARYLEGQPLSSAVVTREEHNPSSHVPLGLSESANRRFSLLSWTEWLVDERHFRSWWELVSPDRWGGFPATEVFRSRTKKGDCQNGHRAKLGGVRGCDDRGVEANARQVEKLQIKINNETTEVTCDKVIFCKG
jgi:hypothetical protein